MKMALPILSADKEKIRIQSIPVHTIQPSPSQSRKNFSPVQLNQLAESIRQNGLLQPVVVRPCGVGRYELIAGERRLRACKLAGLEKIKAVIITADDEQAALLCLVENIQREQLHFFEEAEGYDRLIREHGLTQADLAAKLGRQQSTIANKLRLLRLSSETKELVIRNRLSERHARALLRLPDTESRRKALNKIIANDLNVRETDQMIRDMLEPGQPKQRIKGFYRNWQLVSNSIKTTVCKMRKFGAQIDYDMRDLGDSVQLSIVIPKAQNTNSHI